MPRLGVKVRLAAVLLVLGSGLATAATSYNLERDFRMPGTRAVGFFRTDPLLGIPDAGIVHHFRRADGTLLRTLQSPAPTTDDRFGFSMAVAGTFTPLIAVGAPGDDGAGVDSGAVFVFDGATGAHLRTLRAPNPTPNAQFGFAVAARGDDIIVGAPFGGGAQAGAGAAYLFRGSTGNHLLTFTGSGAGDQFGAAVGRAGNDVLIGAPLDGGTGAAFLFDGATGNGLNMFRGPQAGAGDRFGAAVAPIGGDVIIGAPFAEGNGVVYRFDRLGETPNETYLPPEGAATAFGTTLATVARDFLVSAPGDELEQDPAAFVIDGATGNLIQTFFPLVPLPLRGRFDPPLAASGRDVLIEDALFQSCGRACVVECGNGIVEFDRGETCDDGDNTNAICPNCVRAPGSTTSTTSTTSSTSTTTAPTPTTSSTSTTSPVPTTTTTSTTTAPTVSTSTTSTTTSPTASTSTTSTTTSPTSTAPPPSVTSTSTSPTPSVTSTTAPSPLPGAICTRDSDCSGALCDGTSRCIEGRCQAGVAPDCFEAASCVLSAQLSLASCPQAPPARVTRLLERAYVLVLGAEAAAPDSLKRAKRRLRAAVQQLTRDGKLVDQLADRNKLPSACADALRATIARALEHTNAVRNNLTACAS